MKLGILELVRSAKGTMCLVILACAVWACLTGHLDGASFAAVVSVIGSIFCWTRHATDVASINAGNVPSVIINSVRNSIQGK